MASLLSELANTGHWQEPFYAGDAAACKCKIMDTTGSSNAFLGGFAIGYLESKDYVEASRHGAVASSFMLEQVGLPLLTCDEVTQEELWNSNSPWKRLELPRARDGC